MIVHLGGPLQSVRIAGAPGAAPRTPPPSAEAVAAAEILEKKQVLENQSRQLVSALTALNQAAAELALLREKLIRQSEEQLVGLAIQIAGKVLMQEIQAGRYEIQPIVEAAMQNITPRQEVTVRLNPRDFEQCQAFRASREAESSGAVKFTADQGVGPAECILETSDGVVESNVESHLSEVTEALQNSE